MKYPLLSCLLSTAAALLGQAPATIDWQLDQNAPTRSSANLCYHAASGALIYFGGAHHGGFTTQVFDDTWAFTDTWRRLPTTNAPSGRSDAAIAYDSTRGRLILFGGRRGTTTLGDTWAFDGATWTQLAPTTAPGPRQAAIAVYDSVRDRVVLFSGQPGPGVPAGELWEFDGSNWSLRPQSGAVPSFFSGAVFDRVRGVTLAYGGGLTAWDGTTWTTRSTAGLPSPLPSGPIVYDDDAERVLLVTPMSGSTFNVRLASAFAWQGQDWTPVATSALPTTQYVYMHWDSARRRIVGIDVPDSFVAQSRTWVHQQGQWSIAAWHAPLGRRDAGMAYDRARGRLVVQGGSLGSSAQPDTWENVDGQWMLGASGVGVGPNRSHHSMVYDEAREVVLAYGGTSFGQGNMTIWDGNGQWAFPTPSPAPLARARPAMVYDSLRARTLVFGGESTGGNLGDLWSWSGTGWTQLTPVPGPTARREARMCYDRNRDRVVLFGGSTGATLLGDTWEFDGVQWHALTPPTAPAPRAWHVLVYDEHRQRTVLFGGMANVAGTVGHLDAWTWDGVDWTPFVTPTLPDTGLGVAGAYDSRRQEVVVYGGAGLRGTTWRLRDTGLGVWTHQGHGCDAGAGSPLVLQAQDALRIGRSCRVRLANLPATFVALPLAWVGFQDESWNGLPLPLPLGAIGAPGCMLWADPAVSLPIMALGNGEAVADLWIANDPVFLGHEVFVQAGVWHFAQARAGTANAIAARVGAP
jgi:hypothetical protein